MSSKQERFRIAVLGDYQHVALSLADWSALDARATITVFEDSGAVGERLQPFDIVCVMRERTPMTRIIIERLPKLRMIASTRTPNASIDVKAAEERGCGSFIRGDTSAPTIELTWALSSARNLVAENTSLRGGGCQQSVGDDMAGRTLGVLGSATSAMMWHRSATSSRSRPAVFRHSLQPPSRDGASREQDRPLASSALLAARAAPNRVTTTHPPSRRQTSPGMRRRSISGSRTRQATFTARRCSSPFLTPEIVRMSLRIWRL